ncbi:MAG: tetratricopeptide repeat protein [Endomicrobiia bacterium]
MITKLGLIGLTFFFLVQSIFQIREQISNPKQSEAIQMYQEAEKLMDQGRYDAAIAKYLVITTKYKDLEDIYKEAKFNLMVSYYKNKMYDEMFSVAKEIARDYKDEIIGKTALFFIGEYYFNKKKHDYAVVSYQMFINKIPSSPYLPLAYFNLAKSLYDSQKLDEAISVLKDMERKFKRSALMPDVKYFLIGVFLQKEQPQEALKRLEDVEKSPNIIRLNEIYFNVAEYFFIKGDYDKALIYYNMVKDKQELLKIVEAKLKDYREAKRRGLEATFSETLYDRVEEQQWWKEYDYEALYQEAKESKNFYPETLFKIGSCYLAKGRLDIADKTFTILKTKYKEEKEIIAKIPQAEALLFAKQGKYDQLVKKIAEIKDEDAKIQLLQALFNDKVYQIITSEYKNGVFNFTKKEYIEPATYIIATSFFMIKEYREAIKLYKEFLEKFPSSEYAVVARSNLAMSFFELKDYKTSIEEYKNILSKHPNEQEYVKAAIVQLSEIYKTIGDLKNAIFYYNTFIDRYPTDPEVPNVLIIIGNLYLELKDYQNAINYYVDFVNRYPNHEMVKDAMLQVAVVYKENKQYSDMAAMLKKILEKYPDDPKVAPTSLYWLGWFNKEQGLYQDATSYFENLIVKFPDDENVVVAQYDKAECFEKLKQYESAINEYIKLLSFYEKPQLETSILFSIVDKIFELSMKKLSKTEEETVGLLSKIIDQYKSVKVGTIVALKVAEFYYLKKDYTSAVKYLYMVEDGLSKYKGNADEYYFIADIFFNGKDYKNAYTYYKKSIQTAPKSKTAENAAWGLSECYIALNDKTLSSEVVSLVGPYYSKLQNVPVVLQTLGKSYYIIGNYKKAAEILEKVVPILEEKEGPDWIFMLAESYFLIEDYQQALKYYAKIVLVYGNQPQYLLPAYFKAGNCYEKLGEIEKAKEMYKEIVQKYPNSEYASKAAEKLK